MVLFVQMQLTRISNFIFHPDSNIQIIGYKIPFWDEIITTVKEAALIIDEVSLLVGMLELIQKVSLLLLREIEMLIQMFYNGQIKKANGSI